MRPWRRIALSSIGLIGLWLGNAAAAPSIDHDAFWIESTLCTVTIKLTLNSGQPDAGRMLDGLASVPANCTGNMTTQAQSGGVLALLQRGFRITTAQHQMVLLPVRSDSDPLLLVTALFALERPAVKLAPVTK